MEILGMICKEDAAERKANTQQGIDKKMFGLKEKFDIGNGGYKIWLKIKLTYGNLREHVWIRVTDINLMDSTFYGTIDNDIAWMAEKYSYGDEVVKGFDEIEDIIELDESRV